MEFTAIRGTASEAPPQRVTTREMLDYLLDVAGICARHCGGEMLQGILLLAINQANLAHHDPAPGVPLDTVRRPISVHALAQQFGLSAETTRRHVAGLKSRGLCQRLDGSGVIATADGMTLPSQIQARQERLMAFANALHHLTEIGFDLQSLAAEPRATGAVPTNAEHCEALLADAGNRYFLRTVMDALTVHKTFEAGLFFVAIMAANARHIQNSAQTAWLYSSADTPPPDHARKPVPLSQLAAYLCIPETTVRRQVGKLAADGVAARTKEGAFIPTEVAQRPALLASGLRMHNWLCAEIRDLYRAGVDVEGLAAIIAARSRPPQRIAGSA